MPDTGASGQGQDSTAQATQQGQDPAGSTTENGQQQAQGQAPEGTQQAQGTDDGGPNLDAITDPALRAQVEAALKRAKDANSEAARYRTERNELLTKAQEAQRANETAEQTAQREAQERQQELENLRAENKGLKVGGEFTKAATAAKALDPNGLLTLIGGVDKVETDDDGKPTNLAALITKAKSDYPWAFARTAGTEAGEGGAAASGKSVNDLIRGSR